MANEITFDKQPQAVGYLTEQVERIYKIVAALQPQTAIDKHRIVEIDEACKITRKAKPTIYMLARKGLIPAYKRGKKLYFYEDELLQWIESGRKPLQALNLTSGGQKCLFLRLKVMRYKHLQIWISLNSSLKTQCICI